MAPLLEVHGLCVSVKKEDKLLKILDNISFYIDEGEILGLAGESGCGKTMTALSIANLLPSCVKISEGIILFNNKSLRPLSEKEMCGIRGSEISYIFQDVRQALNPLIKVGKQITEVLELKEKKAPTDLVHGFGPRIFTDFSKIRARNKEAAIELLESLGFTNTEKVFNAYPHQLSGGMCQRIMTAIAVIANPKLLIADEPSSSLDEESQKKSLSYLMEMNQTQKTSLLLISHDLSIIQKYCTRFIIMYAGKIIEEGPADMLFSPLHPYTLALINAIPNKEKRGTDLKGIGGKVPSVDVRLTGCPFAPRCPKVQNICKQVFPPVMEDTQKNRKVYCYFPSELHGGIN
ncbi:MAG: ABC transporter ATP-binding protein [Treponema sp.]|nr:ABC transporter ATP-binding protein [Treponema sp.]